MLCLDERDYLQIDLTPTLSALLQIPIPWNNLGIVIEPVLKNFFRRRGGSLLRCLTDDNRRQISNLLSDAPSSESSSSSDLDSIRHRAISISHEQDLGMLIISVLLFLSVELFVGGAIFSNAPPSL